jgi:BirA family transcriptional regulator, biotin operon repressor / biotin---[acetyl-CoA-carboxylase] ligase
MITGIETFVTLISKHQIEIFFLKKVDSTNTYAKGFLQDIKANKNFAFIAEEQTQGRGNADTSWESEAGSNLTFSIVVQPHNLEAKNQFDLSKATSLGIADFLRNFVNQDDIRIKWPNDIYVNQNKIAGILIENTVAGNYVINSIIGIGLNINQKKFTSRAPNPVSLYQLTNMNYNLKDLIYQLLDYLFLRIHLMHKEESIHNEYLGKLYRFNEFHPYHYNGERIHARIERVNSFGQLELISSAGNNLVCSFKEIEFIL